MGLETGLAEALRTGCFQLRGEFTAARLDYLERTRGFATIQNLIVGRDITGVSAFG